ncbi:MAG: helix-turn-helix transcriptional regulator [Clostridia bacterium]|nr:helix-turn-helix transcriptional regulator [Clostridia bacterium]
MNQIEFARIIGVTKQCVSNWENDNVLPSIEMLIKIADLFHVSTDYLLGRSSKHLVDMSGLTEEQIAHISLLTDDFERLNKAKE